MIRLTIIRKKGFYGMARALKLVVDGEVVGQVKSGETLDILLPEGAQTLWGQMDWGKTRHFDLSDVKDGDVVVFKPWFTFNTLRQLGIMALPFKISRR